MTQISWPEEIKSNKEPSELSEKFSGVGRKVFWSLIIGSLIVLAIGGFYLYQYFTARDISFSLKAPTNIYIGVPFNIEIEIQNNSDNLLKDTKISMILPEGTALLAENQDKRVLSRNFGDLDANSNFQEKISVLIFKNEQSIKKFEITASYFPPSLGPKARFEIAKSVEVTAREPGIKLDLIAFQGALNNKVLNNEDFEIEINYQNISDIDFSNVELELQYPKSFTFSNADPKPSANNNFWKIGNLAKKSPAETIVFSGKAIGAEQSFFEIKSVLKAEFAGQKYLINEKTISVNIAPSPLSLGITVNNQPDYLAFPNGDLKYKIISRNNSDIGLSDVIIKARLVGEMFDFKSLKTGGVFNSKDNTIIWNVANTPALRLLLPAAEGTVEFEIKTKDSYPIKRISDKNFILGVEAEISSPTVPYYVASDKTIGFAKSEIKVAGAAVISAEADFLKGFFPPKTNKQSTYLIRWAITNYSTDISNIKVKAYLQSGARWLGQVKSNINSIPNYNERTQEVVWLIDSIPATKGVISKPIEATFQIEVAPNITQVGQYLALLSETTFRAFDEFAKIELKNTAKDLNSASLVSQ
ncbi:MAG: hypothetical protein Q8N28_01935 [bacterium]|nr:hypothetical protein [bacterium]